MRTKGKVRFPDILNVNTVARISFAQFEELDPSVSEAFVAELYRTMDEPFGNAANVEELLETFAHKLVSWVIMSDETPVGFFGLSLSLTLPNHYQTSSFILKNWRGKKIGPLVKIAVAQSFLQHSAPLITCIREWNFPSIRSFERTFPELVAVRKMSAFKDADGNDYYLRVYNLSLIEVTEVPEEATDIFEAVNMWLTKEFATKVA